MKPTLRLSLSPLILLLACNPPASPPAASQVEQGATESTNTNIDQPTAVAGEPADDHAEGHGEWLSLQAGRELAAAESRNLLVYVYADWCARCRELEPVIESPDVMTASDQLVHVRHNSDVDDSSWLREAAQDRDGYVPRVLFLRSDGTRLPLVSDHPRYPLFYTPAMKDTLLANIQLAQQGS